MRSSELDSRVIAVADCVLVLSCVLIGACSTLPATDRSQSPASAPECVAEGAPTSPQQTELLGAVRRSVESGPLYAIGSRAGAPTCRVRQDDTAIRLEYAFRDGTTLRVTRNPQIEYTDQELRPASALGEDAVAVLTRAEQAAFGDKGCGINWRQPETAPATRDGSGTERIYRGDTCNCQARTRTDASGRVLMLSLRSTC